MYERTLPQTSIVVVSFDGYADLWEPFFHCFFKYWSDCPYPIFLGCGEAAFRRDGVTTLNVGTDVDYSSNILAMLHSIHTPSVILWTDDFLLNRPVSTARVQRIIDALRSSSAGYIDLLRFPTRISALFAQPTGIDGVAEMPRGAPYRASLGVTLWRTDFLRTFLRPGESAWDIERRGGERSEARSEAFLCVEDAPIAIVNVVERRAITRGGLALLGREGLTRHLSSRTVEPWSRRLKIGAYSTVRYTFVYLCTMLLGTSRAAALINWVVRTRALSIQN